MSDTDLDQDESLEDELLEDEAVEETVDGEVTRTTLPPLARISALLFVASKPMSADKLADAARLSLKRVERVLGELQEYYQDEVHGFSLQQVAGGWQLRTAQDAAEVVRRLIPRKVKRLSRAAAETLAVVAYKQPAERAEIESIRGVDALPTLKTLLDAKLIRIVGNQDAIGQPALYGTTTKFLEQFGLRDLSELPSLHELEQLLSEPGEASESSKANEEGESAEAA